MRRQRHWCAAILLVAVPLAGTAAPRVGATLSRPAVIELPGKPTGPIVVDYRLANAPAVGVPLAITITARVESGADLRLEIAASQPSSALLTVPALTTREAGRYSWEVTVVPLAADAGYLNVIVAGDVDGVAQASSVTIALRGVRAAPAAVEPPAAQSEALIALPVRETP